MITQLIHRPSKIMRGLRGLFHQVETREETPLLSQTEYAQRLRGQQQQDRSKITDVTIKGTHNDVQNNDLAIARMYADKAYYNDWINLLSIDFKKGDLVTLRMYPFIPGRKEIQTFFIVEKLEEVRSMAMWDTYYKQPRALGLIMPTNGRELYFAPAGLRSLHKEEQELVYVQHPNLRPAASPATGEDLERRDNEGYSG